MHNKRSPLTDTPIGSSVSGVLFAFLPTFTGKQRINEKKSAPFRLNLLVLATFAPTFNLYLYYYESFARAN